MPVVAKETSGDELSASGNTPALASKKPIWEIGRPCLLLHCGSPLEDATWETPRVRIKRTPATLQAMLPSWVKAVCQCYLGKDPLLLRLMTDSCTRPWNPLLFAASHRSGSRPRSDFCRLRVLRHRPSSRYHHIAGGCDTKA